MNHYRTARANWRPTNWDAFCKQTVADANRDYRRQLLTQASGEELTAMYRELMKRRATGHDVEDQLCDIDREFALRTAT
jgi:hypothetical protein